MAMTARHYLSTKPSAFLAIIYMSVAFSPSAVIFINHDLTEQVLSVLVAQLRINQVMGGEYFDAIVKENPNFHIEVHNYRVRILVLRNLHDTTNRDLADIVLFAKAGLI